MEQFDVLGRLVERLEGLGMEYYITGSERQWKDARGVVLVQKERLDMGYMKKWAAALSLDRELDSLIADKSLPNTT